MNSLFIQGDIEVYMQKNLDEHFMELKWNSIIHCPDLEQQQLLHNFT